jgi:hypothetical protein
MSRARQPGSGIRARLLGLAGRPDIQRDIQDIRRDIRRDTQGDTQIRHQGPVLRLGTQARSPGPPVFRPGTQESVS